MKRQILHYAKLFSKCMLVLLARIGHCLTTISFNNLYLRAAIAGVEVTAT